MATTLLANHAQRRGTLGVEYEHRLRVAAGLLFKTPHRIFQRHVLRQRFVLERVEGGRVLDRRRRRPGAALKVNVELNALARRGSVIDVRAGNDVGVEVVKALASGDADSRSRI